MSNLKASKMKKAATILALFFCVSAFAQQEIRLYDGVAPGGEGVQDNERIQRGPGGMRMGGGGQALSASVTEFSKISKSNANPDTSESGIKNIDNAINDALRAMEIVREHAAEWHINPDKIGYLGFSAGGGVGIGATVRADAAHRPAFMATIYGPSLIDVEVPQNAPEIFIATRGDHHNVAAGLVSLYLDWKRAGANAEMHLYDDGTGPFGPDDIGNTSGTWRESFYRWLQFNHF